jgi:hypothetical protein
VALRDERLILPVEKAAVEVRGGQPLATTALGLHEHGLLFTRGAGTLNEGIQHRLVCGSQRVLRVRRLALDLQNKHNSHTGT